MFILNPEKINNKIGFKEKVSKYLENHGVPLLAIEGDIYYFVDTELLRSTLKTAPWWVKLSKTCTQ